MGTRFYLVLIVVAASLVLATGCRNRSRSGGPRPLADSGMVGVDSGPTPMTDSGPIVIMDSGMTRVDSGPTPECFSNSDCLSSEMCSGGRCVPMTSTCPTDTLTRVTTQMCADTTRTCVEGCADGTCIASCLEADPDPSSCIGCVNNNIFSCWNRNGCQSQWNCVAECAATRCSPDDTTCLDTTCSAEWTTYQTCGDGVPDSASCGSDWAPCVGL